MNMQQDLFGATSQTHSPLPEGLVYQPDFISPAEERRLLEGVQVLPFRAFDFKGYQAKRRIVSFGWRYDFSSQRLQAAPPIPAFLLELRPALGAFTGLEPEALVQVLVTEYEVGAGIDWHRDKAVFGKTAGLSLLAPCVFRMRRSVNGVKGKWQRARFIAEARSAYLLSGPSRTHWEHSIPPVDSLRYSITYRTLKI